MEIQHFSHEHPLIQYCHPNKDDNDDHEIKCSGCRLHIGSGSTYGCMDCNFFLHKSCTELPREIQHHFHPHHPLTLQLMASEFSCNTCYEYYSDGFSYHCAMCPYNLDLPCASLNPTINFEYSNHRLYLFEKTSFYHVCQVCFTDSDTQVFRCVIPSCYYIQHIHCSPFSLPDTIKDKCHLHTLAFKKSHVEDDSGEYYCDACEKERNPIFPVYFCAECEFVAHIGCVIPEVLPSLIEKYESDSKARGVSALDPTLVKLDAEIKELCYKEDTLKDELEALTEKLKALKGKRCQHVASCNAEHKD